MIDILTWLETGEVYPLVNFKKLNILIFIHLKTASSVKT